MYIYGLQTMTVTVDIIPCPDNNCCNKPRTETITYSPNIGWFIDGSGTVAEKLTEVHTETEKTTLHGHNFMIIIASIAHHWEYLQLLLQE